MSWFFFVFKTKFGIIYVERSEIMKAQIISALEIVFITFVFSTIIMFLMRKVAYHIGALDMPREEEEHRHIHKKITQK